MAEWSRDLVPDDRLLRWREMPLAISHVAARLGSGIDFANPHYRAALSTHLEALAQAEEPEHPPGIPGEPQIPCAILNSKHWSACSYSGAAHFVADQFDVSQQPSKQSFDPQRLYNASTRYFLAFAAALAQRLTLERLHNQGVRLTQEYETSYSAHKAAHRHGANNGAHAYLDTRRRSLRDETLAFAIRGHVVDISYRDAMNRFYDPAQRAFRVNPTLQLVRLTIRDLDAAHQNTGAGRRYAHHIPALRPLGNRALLSRVARHRAVESFLISNRLCPPAGGSQRAG